jgi:hypothetical protein
MTDDCCCANFERALFRFEAAVDEFKGWACYKVEVSTVKNADELAAYELRKDKPALLLLDAEGGLLHKQQLCVDPGKFMRVIQSAKRLSDLRFRLKERYLAKRAKAREHIEDGSYDRALRILTDLLGDREKLSGQVQGLVEGDMTQLASTARARLDAAKKLEDENRLLDSYRMYKEIEKEFARLDELGREAQEHRRSVASELKKLGVSIR